MRRAILGYSLAIAAAAVLLQWLEYQYLVRAFSVEIYIAVVAIFFTALGIWVGHRITAGRVGSPEFEKNTRALEYLGISNREYEVLELLAAGLSNKEIGAKLFVSPNTVKTHLANLYTKLEVSKRLQAVQKARELALIR